MYRIILLLFFFLPLQTQAQKSLKVYSNFQFHKSRPEPLHFDDRSNNGFRYSGLTFAYRNIIENGLLLQVEPKFLFQSKNDEFQRIETGVRFECGGAIKKPIFKILYVRLGYFARIYYLNEQIEAGVISPGSVQRTKNSGGIAHGPFIAFEVKLGKRFYLEANTAFNRTAIGVDYQYIDNPNRTNLQNRTWGFDLDVGGERFFRLGLGVNL